MKFSVSILHHPSREHLLPGLTAQLKEYVVYTDYGWGLAENSKRAWKSYDKSKDFHLVLDDDSILCKDFLNKAEDVLKDKSVIYSLHWGKREIPKPDIINGFFPAYLLFYGNATAIPTDKIDDLLEYAKDFDNSAFDERITAWVQFNKILVMTPIPCLVDHNHLEKSLAGSKEGDRRSWCFIDNMTDNRRDNGLHD